MVDGTAFSVSTLQVRLISLLSCPVEYLWNIYQGWQKAGFYSYCPGHRLLLAITGFK